MATLEDELKDLREKNNELAQTVQYWKMTAAQKDDDKLILMKEINELRLKLSRLRNNGGFQARKLDAALQDASEKAISHLVKASAEIAKSMEIAKAYMRERQELDNQSPRWSSIGGTPKIEKTGRVHRVPPMMMGGQSIQPVVALSRTLLNSSNPRSTTRSPNQNHSLTERAVPLHMLQDVYIPLTRIDASEIQNNNDMDMDVEATNAEDSPEEFVDDFVQRRLDSDNYDSDDDHISEADEYDASKLEPVSEEETTETVRNSEQLRISLHITPGQERWPLSPPPDRQPEPAQTKPKPPDPPREHSTMENPLEGPSWLLDHTPTNTGSPMNTKKPTPKNGRNFEPDSTTEVEKTSNTPGQKIEESTEAEGSPAVARAFSPTLRRRKRTSSPPPPATPLQHRYSPRPASARRNSTSGRVLKVLVAKMRLDGSPESASPPKRARSPPQHPLIAFDAPSPNGATDSRVIVSETRARSDKETKTEHGSRNTSRRESHESQQRARVTSQDRETLYRRRHSRDHDSIRFRTNSEHERRIVQDGRESHSRGLVANDESHETTHSVRQRSRLSSRDSRDSDSGSGGGGDSVSEGRTRRARKPVTYKEKPLNRKMRR